VWSGEPPVAKIKMFALEGEICRVGPRATGAGDLVVVMSGLKVPLVLRKRPDGDGYINLGDAYVQVDMDERALDNIDVKKDE
jgi:hypothetical protein